MSPGPCVTAMASQIFVSHVSFVHRLRHDGADGFGMGAGGDFGEDTAVLRVQVNLRGDHVGIDRHSVGDDSGSGFVTGCLDGEDGGHGEIVALKCGGADV